MNEIILIVMLGYNPNGNTTHPVLEVIEYSQPSMLECQRQQKEIRNTESYRYDLEALCLNKGFDPSFIKPSRSK